MLNIMEVLLMSNEASWKLQCKVWDNQDKLDESVNNYECTQAMEDLKKVVKASQPYVNKVVTKVKEVTQR